MIQIGRILFAVIRSPLVFVRGLIPGSSPESKAAVVSTIATLFAVSYSFIDDLVNENLSLSQRLGFAIPIGLVCFFLSLAFLRRPDRRGWKLRWNVEKLRLTLLLQRSYLEPNSPLLGFMAGWMNRVIDEFEVWRPLRVTIGGAYWKYCIDYLEEQDEVRAFADLSPDVEEKLPPSVNTPVSTKIRERIYLCEWRDIFDPKRLEAHLERVKAQTSSGRRAYLSHVPAQLSDQPSGPFEGYQGNLGEFDRILGWSIFLMRRDIVGGFVRSEDKSRLLLHVRQDGELWNVVDQNYRRLQSSCFLAQESTSLADFRRFWIDTNKIGEWTWGKSKVPERGANYWDKYDAHIRSWVPEYEQLLAACADQVKYEVIQQVRALGGSQRNEIQVLEIGFGTGHLSFQMLDWIEDFNRPLEATLNRMQAREDLPGVRLGFTAIDSAAETWLERMRAQEGLLRSYGSAAMGKVFKYGTFPSDLGSIPASRYDVICSSLVFHDLVPSNPEKKHFMEMLDSFKAMLRPGGSVVIADVFTAGDDRKLSWWKSRMHDAGLSGECISSFFDNNEDMFRTFDPEDLKKWAEEQGCKASLNSLYPQTHQFRDESPFGVLVIRFSKNAPQPF